MKPSSYPVVFMQLTHYFCPWLLGWHQCNVIHAIMWIQRGLLPSGDHTLALTRSTAWPILQLLYSGSLFQCDISQVCREYQRGSCTRAENECRFAHPADSTMIDTNDNTVTVCMDYIKGRCSREKCKYFHPPAHLQAKIKATQHQVNQATAAAAMVSTPLPRSPLLLRGSCAGVTFSRLQDETFSRLTVSVLPVWRHVAGFTSASAGSDLGRV